MIQIKKNQRIIIQRKKKKKNKKKRKRNKKKTKALNTNNNNQQGQNNTSNNPNSVNASNRDLNEIRVTKIDNEKNIIEQVKKENKNDDSKHTYSYEEGLALFEKDFPKKNIKKLFGYNFTAKNIAHIIFRIIGRNSCIEDPVTMVFVNAEEDDKYGCNRTCPPNQGAYPIA